MLWPFEEAFETERREELPFDELEVEGWRDAGDASRRAPTRPEEGPEEGMMRPGRSRVPTTPLPPNDIGVRRGAGCARDCDTDIYDPDPEFELELEWEEVDEFCASIAPERP